MFRNTPPGPLLHRAGGAIRPHLRRRRDGVLVAGGTLRGWSCGGEVHACDRNV